MRSSIAFNLGHSAVREAVSRFQTANPCNFGYKIYEPDRNGKRAKAWHFKQLAKQFNRFFLLMPVMSFLLSGCASPNQIDLSSENLNETLKILAVRHRVCGVTIAVIRDRKLDSIDSATGCLPRLTPNSNSIFQAASLSKPVFSYAVMKLVEQGKLELDAPVVSYLPQGYRHQFDPLDTNLPLKTDLVTDPRIQAVTVRMILNHTSGLPNWASGPLNFDSSPGEKWEYSGEGFVLLQRAVEAVAGEPLDRFMTSQVFKPLGMDHSDYVWSERIARNVLPGTKANGAPRTTLDLAKPIAAFSLYTSAADYGKFLVSVLNDDRMLKQLTASPILVDPKLNLSWGLGWGIEHGQGDNYIWHWGNNTGYRAFVIASARTGDGFVMLTNSENGLKLAEPITHKILPGEHKLFQSSIFGEDIINLVCKILHLCL